MRDSMPLGTLGKLREEWWTLRVIVETDTDTDTAAAAAAAPPATNQ